MGGHGFRYHPEAVCLDSLLFVRDMSEDEMHKRGRRNTTGSAVEAPTLDRHGEQCQRQASPEPERESAGDNLRAIPVGQQRISKRVCLGMGGFLPPVSDSNYRTRPLHDPVGNRGEKGLLIDEMPVQGTRLHVEHGSEATHREVGQAVLVEDAEGRSDDVLASVAHRPGTDAFGFWHCVSTITASRTAFR